MAINVITIDGLSGVGKTATARVVQRETHLMMLEAGMLYRSCGYLCVKLNVDLADPVSCAAVVSSMQIDVPGPGKIIVNGKDLSDVLRSAWVGEATSQIAVHAGVREKLRDFQRRYAVINGGLVVDGRSSGIEIFPDAVLKTWLLAAPEVRLARKGILPGSQAAELLARRDWRDAKRTLSPTSRPMGAIGIDTSRLSLEQVASWIVRLYWHAKAVN